MKAPLAGVRVKLAYFVHDLTDPAVARRVRMLKAGGAEPVLFGFRRAETVPEALEGRPTHDLGRTYDARLAHRVKMTARAAVGSGRLKRALAGAEVVLARTLEMLAVAEAGRWACGLRAPLVYECLDVHRVLLQDTVKGYALRTLERGLMRRASGLIVSSPAFLDRYFRPIQGLGDDLHLPAMLVENKALELEDSLPPPRPLPPPPGPPWRIGWLGALRCRKSLELLRDLAVRRPDLVDIRLYGRPARSAVDDFDAQVTASPNLTFGGSYAAADLPRLYGELHFAWAIDFMEEGLNSAWLLPNRLYEASRYGALPIALSSVETGRWLAERSFGIRLASTDDLEGFLEGLTPATYEALRTELEGVPPGAFVADESDCRRLVEGLKRPAEAFGSYGQAIRTNDRSLAA